MRSTLTAIVLALALASEAVGQEPDAAHAVLHRLTPATPATLQDLLRYSQEALPLVSAHRGGPQSGFPENCIPTFENTLRHTFALLEIDPRYTKDGEIVLLHDPTLERTTTGKGKVADFTFDELKKLRLKDPAGKVTDFPIPKLDDVLKWARGKTGLVLDQKDVPVAARVKKVTDHKAENYALLIVYSFADAKTCYELNPNISMEVMVPNRDKFAEFDKLGVPWRNVIAFVGHNPPEDERLYQLLHEKGVCCLIGTSRNLDKQVINQEVDSIQKLETDYRAYLKRGADIIETDIPVQLGPMLYRTTAAPTPRQAYFVKPDAK